MSQTVDESFEVTGYHRKYAIRKLSGPLPGSKPERKHRRGVARYGPRAIWILHEVWEAAG